MAYALVFLAALLVGGLVYVVTLRQEVPPPQAPSTGTVYVPVVAANRSWETRLTGLAGILVIVSLAAVVLALAVYAAGSFLVGLVTDAAGNGGVNGGAPLP